MPPFFIPILGFALWVALQLFTLPILRLNLILSDQLVAALFFISFLILTYAWAFSGPITAAVLSLLACGLCLYLALGTREPALFMQIFIYAALFLFMVSYLLRIQRENNEKQIAREKLNEEVYLTRDKTEKKESIKAAVQNKIGHFLDLRQLSDELKEVKSEREAADRIVMEVHSVVAKADECLLYLVDETKHSLMLAAGINRRGQVIKEKEGTCFDQWVMRRAQGLVVEDAETDFRFSAEDQDKLPAFKSICANPLVTENRVLGVIRLSSSKAGLFNSDDLRLLDIFAGLGAVTLRNILLYKKMSELAIHDSLTGLYLNRYFQDRLSEETQRAVFDKSALSLVLMDIDFFKRYNDEFGHLAGDLVLKSFAAIIQQHLGPADFAARYGGEEFVAVLPHKTKQEAVEIAEKIRQALEKSKFVLRRVEGRVTASFGVAEFPADGRTKEELIWAADQHLYRAKNSGRNKVSV